MRQLRIADSGARTTSHGVLRTLSLALLFLIVSGTFAAEEGTSELVRVRNRVLLPVSLNDVAPYYTLLDLAVPRPVLSNEVVGCIKLETTPSETGGIRLAKPVSFTCAGCPAVSKVAGVVDLASLCGLLGATVAGIVNPREFGPELVLDIGRAQFAIHATGDAVLHDEKDPRTVKMTVTDTGPTVPALIDGSTLRACAIDTTFGGTLAIPESLLADLGITLDKAPKLVARSVPGVMDDPEGRVQIRLKGVRVGPVEVRDALCAIELGHEPPRLGIGFLRHFRATLNFDRGLARWETDSTASPRDETIVGCGLGLAAFQRGHWTVWVALNSPADREGVAPGSVLLSVNGKDMEGLSYADAFAALPSEEGKEAEVVLSHGNEARSSTLRAEKLL